MDIIIYNDLISRPTTPCILASRYLLGILVDKDEAKGIKILDANQNCLHCVNLLGHCYDNGIGVEKDISKAVRLYQRAIDMGNPLAMFNLAVCYKYGQGVEKDLSKAVGLYQQAADMGNSNAMNNLGNCYNHGQGVEKDISKAVGLYQRAADMGNPLAMFNLGYCYSNGIGVEKDISKAVELYQRAAEKGDKTALTNLYTIGEMYEKYQITKKHLNYTSIHVKRASNRL